MEAQCALSDPAMLNANELISKQVQRTLPVLKPNDFPSNVEDF